MHYQLMHEQGKIVRVVAGEIFDVVVDVRLNSPTFGHWVNLSLSAKNRHQVWIPRGFAHGFYVLSKKAEILYKFTAYQSKEWERVILWNDPLLAIPWPLIHEQQPIISARDSHGILLSEADLFE
jgi:dTDP-4-dehydrorhamnose 3,5-epimerase